MVATSGLEGLTTAEWTALQTFEHEFSVRQITAYAYPSSDYGLTTPAAGQCDRAPLHRRLRLDQHRPDPAWQGPRFASLPGVPGQDAHGESLQGPPGAQGVAKHARAYVPLQVRQGRPRRRETVQADPQAGDGSPPAPTPAPRAHHQALDHHPAVGQVNEAAHGNPQDQDVAPPRAALNQRPSGADKSP